MPGLKMAYIEHIGAYKDIGYVFDDLIKELKEKGIEMSFDSHAFIGTHSNGLVQQCSTQHGADTSNVVCPQHVILDKKGENPMKESCVSAVMRSLRIDL